MFCSKCGNELQDGQSFCPKCGEKNDAQTNATTKHQPSPFLTPSPSSEEHSQQNGKIYIVAFIVCIIAFVVSQLTDTSDNKKNEQTSTIVDEDALADKNCKNDLGFSNIYVCRRALSSAGLDADKYIREKWITTGNRIKGIGFCEGFTRSGHSDQFKVHYDKDCKAKELYIWSNQAGDFQRVK